MFPLRTLLLTLFLLCLPATALALDYTVSCNRPYGTTEQCQFDSNAAAWFDRASTWPSAGPIFNASHLVAATYTTFEVHGVLETDAPFVGQTVCQGDPQYCPEPYYRECCFSFQEANTELWHMIFTQPVLGILFDEGDAVRTSEFWLAGNFTGGDQQRTAYGLPNLPTSFGFLTDHLVYELQGRQNHEPESGAFCCPVPLFAIGPAAVTPVPEPGTWLLVGSGVVAAAGHRVYRRRRPRTWIMLIVAEAFPVDETVPTGPCYAPGATWYYPPTDRAWVERIAVGLRDRGLTVTIKDEVR